jgi:N-acetyl-anhydromuramyl-L-alanine amidase AmpD
MIEDHHWPDTGQHFTISRGGLILEGRHGSLAAARAGRVVHGSHAVSSDGSANRTWIGIELEGDNRTEDRVTDQQYSALVELCAWLIKWRGLQTLPLKGHMDVLAGHTDCPGLFENRIAGLREDVDIRRAQLG